jgi:hypothetical protein
MTLSMTTRGITIFSTVTFSIIKNQHNDTKHNAIQKYGTNHNDTQHKVTSKTFSIMTPRMTTLGITIFSILT